MKHALKALLGASLLSLAAPALAQDIVASGLDNPRGLAFGFDGELYIAEAGRGGDDDSLCYIGPSGSTTCPGLTGRISVVDADGTQSVFADGLYSTASPDGSAAEGPHDIAVAGRRNLFALVGLSAPPAKRDELRTLGIDGFGGEIVKFAGHSDPKGAGDLTAVEAASNPDNGGLNSNPYGLLYDRDRETLVVADAGSNAVFSVEDKDVTTLSALPPRPSPLFPDFGPPVTESVPTDVVAGPDGAYYVAEFTGFPFLEGQARVWRVTPEGNKTVWADGFSNIMQMAATGDGLFIVELAANGLFAGPIGAVQFVPWDDPTSETTVAQGLFAPGGIAVDEAGDLYVSVASILPGAGQVIRIPDPLD